MLWTIYQKVDILANFLILLKIVRSLVSLYQKEIAVTIIKHFFATERAERILLRPVSRGYEERQVASAYAKASADRSAYAKALSRQARREAKGAKNKKAHSF